MLKHMLHAKIHRARVTGKSLDYTGSITIDPVLLEASGIAVEEQVTVSDLANGARFETYVIAGKRGAGQIELNGAAARLAEVGDLVIIMAYALVDADDLEGWSAKIVQVDSENRPANS